MNFRTYSRALLCGCLAIVGAANAAAPHKQPVDVGQAQPTPAVLDTKLVQYPFDPNKHYNIITSANKMTHLEFGQDERVVGVYLIDSQTSWRTITSQATHRDVFLTPMKDGLSNSGTIITTKRQYELTLITEDTNSYYQRVSWVYPESDAVSNAGGNPGGFDMGVEMLQDGTNNTTVQGHDRGDIDSADMKVGRQRGGKDNVDSPPAATDVDQPLRVDLNHANFDYQIDGDAPFRPSQVFDDGHFTYIKLSAQSIPGAWELTKDGQGELLPFVPRNGYFLVNRIPEYGIVLILGGQQVRIYNRQSKACGFFGCRNKPVTNIVGQGS